MHAVDQPLPSAWGPKRAWIALVLFAATAAFFVAITFSPLKSGFADAPDQGPGDIQLYRAEIERIRQGESYYDAAAGELRERGYPTQKIFNWRMPLPMWLIGKLPERSLANALLGVASLALICLAFHLLAGEAGIKQGFLCVLLLSGAVLPCVLGDLVVMSELWSGVLLALSAVLFGIKRPGWGVLTGVAALFFRELVGPYCLVCMALAARERRYRELAWWLAGLAAYGIFFAAHVWQVLPRITPHDVAHADGWIRFGGAGFLISTAQMNVYLLLLPQWVTALYLACVLLGAASWNTPAGQRVSLTVVVYVVLFSMVGHDFNQYWGSLTAPLFCLAAARAPGTLANLLAAIPPRSNRGERLVSAGG